QGMPPTDDMQALRAVVEGTAAGVGQEFFRSLVRHLAQAIGVPYVVVGEFLERPRGRIHAWWERGRVVECRGFDYTTGPGGGGCGEGLSGGIDPGGARGGGVHGGAAAGGAGERGGERAGVPVNPRRGAGGG